VWAGGRLIIWGGRDAPSDSGDGRTLGDGAALSLDGGTWTPTASSPFPHGLFRPAGAWDGHDVIIVGSECDEDVPPNTTGESPPCRGPAAAAWNPRTNRWRRLDAPPIPLDRSGDAVLPPLMQAAGADGRAVFVAPDSSAAFSWDRRARSWTAVTAPAGAGDHLWACGDGSRRWVVSTAGSGDGPWPVSVWTIRPGAGRWSGPVVPGPTAVEPTATSSCGGGDVVTSRFDGRRSSGSLIDADTGEVTAAFATVGPEVGREATGFGPWLFVSTVAQPWMASTTTTTVSATGPPATAAPGSRPTLTVRRLPGGRELPAGTTSNLFTLTGPDATYVGRGIVICDLERPEACRVWIPPRGA
jgi:hypothetical protein